MPRSDDAGRGTTCRPALLAAALCTVGTDAVIAGVLPEIAASLHVTTQDVSSPTRRRRRRPLCTPPTPEQLRRSRATDPEAAQIA